MSHLHRLWPDATPAIILDILESDPWQTTSHLTMRTGRTRNTTQKALRRLKDRGLVDSRPVTGERRRWGHGDATEHEWRALP